MDDRGEEPPGNHQEGTSPLSLTPDDEVTGAWPMTRPWSGWNLIPAVSFNKNGYNRGKGSRSSLRINLTAKSRSFRKFHTHE
jgi:hypothetical protein